MYGRLASVLVEVLPPRHAEETKEVSPKSKKQSDKGTTYLEREFATVAESSGPEDMCAAIALDKKDGGVMMGGLHDPEVELDFDFVKERSFLTTASSLVEGYSRWLMKILTSRGSGHAESCWNTR
jgi:hypothetical protein